MQNIFIDLCFWFLTEKRIRWLCFEKLCLSIIKIMLFKVLTGNDYRSEKEGEKKKNIQQVWLYPKLYIPRTINTWADKNGRVACTSIQTQNSKKYRNLDCIPGLKIQFRIYFQQKNLQNERNKPWFRPWSNILQQPQSIVDARR